MSLPKGLLLDTHVSVWWRLNEPRLKEDARATIAAAELVFVSVASAWEAAIKLALGKLRFPGSFEAAVLASRFERLSIAFRHAEAVATLPHHHSDPFDRMLIAQCLCERLVLVTRDRKLAAYGIEIIGV
jgi:PIN domain nuclease of toxin-antitoxin system